MKMLGKLSKPSATLTALNKRSFSLAAVAPRAFGIQERLFKQEAQADMKGDPLLTKIANKEPIRVTVTGAAGAIGYATVFRIANGELLGPDQPIILNCLELPQAQNALKGVAMELEDCAFPNLTAINLTDDPNKAFDGCEVALLIASKPRGPGMERNDLLKDNGVIFQKMGQIMNRAAANYCRSTVVGNPCNTNCLILANNCPDISVKNFTAMTRLDHDRAVSILARKQQLPVNEINNFCIWGNHSAKLFPDVRATTMHGVPFDELIGAMRAERFYVNEFIPKVQQRGARIIQVRGSSSAASAGNACMAHTRDWCLGSPQPDWTSMAVVSRGEYGVTPGLVFSYPVECYGGAYQIASYPYAFDSFQQYHIEQNIAELEMERDAVKEYLPN